jgi:hypothetical protein
MTRKSGERILQAIVKATKASKDWQPSYGPPYAVPIPNLK